LRVLAFRAADDSKGDAESTHLIIEKTRRLSHSFRNFQNFSGSCLPPTAHTAKDPPMLDAESPFNAGPSTHFLIDIVRG
jgi:hypothetical protein